MNLLQRHEAFLECQAVERPLVGYWIGGYYPADQFPRGTSLWANGARLRPEEVSFAPFATDYEELYRQHRDAGGDYIFFGSAYWGIPWLEAILGCPVAVAAANCRAEPCLENLGDIDRLGVDLEDNPWLNALQRFTRELVQFSDGRYPVCPTLLRGPGDAAGALLGHTAFIMGLVDEPERMRTILELCARTRLAVLGRLHKLIPAWQGTHAAGGYPSRVWCRRTVAYHQEDSAAWLNPRFFREFLLPPLQLGCRAAEVNFIHLHSACLYPLEILLEDRSFDVFEINLDHEGVAPKVSQLIPTFRRIQEAGRPLVLWGDGAPDEWELIRRELSPRGLSLQPFAKQDP